MATDLTSIAWRNQQPSGLLPIPTRKVIRAKEGPVSEKLAYDVRGFGLNEVRKLLVSITGEETAQQIALGNPPSFVAVDNIRGRSITQAQRRTMVSFGARLKVQALVDLRAGLMRAISSATEKRSGRLSNPNNWRFRYVRNGRVEPLPLGGASGIPMGPRDFIVLMPSGVVDDKGGAYATVANMRVAGTGRLSFRRSEKAKRIARRHQSIGFMALAARAAQASPAFGGFTVTAGFTTKYALPGELTKLGGVRTAFIKIRPKTGRGARRG